MFRIVELTSHDVGLYFANGNLDQAKLGFKKDPLDQSTSITNNNGSMAH